MSWYAIDAVDKAFSRTKKALFEPFDFWKWVKLAIIVFFVGGIGTNYGGSGTNYQTASEDFGGDFPTIEPGDIPAFPSSISGIGLNYIQSVEPLVIIASVMVFFIFLVLIFSYISSIMEFVFVEALVKNDVHLWAYIKKFMRKGFNLLLIRLAVGLLFLILFALALLPFIPLFVTESPDFALPAFIGGMFWILGVIILLALIGAFISSFLSLAIPLSIYRETGILSAFGMVYRNFRENWQDVLVYWFIRFALGVGIGFLALILFGVLVLALAVVFLIIDGVLYFIFSTFVSEPLIWIVLIPFVLMELLFIFVTLMLLSVPLAVFMKYHLLSFLETWFTDANIPFFDKLSSGEPEIDVGIEPEAKTGGSKQIVPEQNISEKTVSKQIVSEQAVSGQTVPEKTVQEQVVSEKKTVVNGASEPESSETDDKNRLSGQEF